MTPTNSGRTRKSATGASLRDRLRPMELLGLSAVVAAFIGVIVMMSTRAIEPTLIFAGLTFIITLMTFAMLALTATPRADEQLDIDGQNLDARNPATGGDAPQAGPSGH